MQRRMFINMILLQDFFLMMMVPEVSHHVQYSQALMSAQGRLVQF
jgi:hypothetical protein